MKIHFIAIGGSVMHNLAIALHKKGYQITGSDDEIFEPSKSRLARYGLMPISMGWHPNRIHRGLDSVILGMHAKADNPELTRAVKLGLKIHSYPEFLYEHSQNKTRIVIAGSHGKTTITSIILHVLNYHKINTDFVVGAHLDGFEVMVKLSDDAPYIVIEGDEYLSSTIDRRPKFHLYKPHIALINGIAWDHINVFPTFENYLDQFRIFIRSIEENGKLIYCQDDDILVKLCNENQNKSLCLYPFKIPDHEIIDGKTYIRGKKNLHPINIFGRHNLMNLSGALTVCRQLGISNPMFYEAISSFNGASNRLELVAKGGKTIVFKDFAHAPSKVKASIRAVKEQFKARKLYAFLELHTYSSLNSTFIDQYNGTLDDADECVIFYNPHTLKLKGLPGISPGQIKNAFKKPGLVVVDEPDKLREIIWSKMECQGCFLFMSSGNFGNLNLQQIASELVK